MQETFSDCNYEITKQNFTMTAIWLEKGGGGNIEEWRRRGKIENRIIFKSDFTDSGNVNTFEKENICVLVD